MIIALKVDTVLKYWTGTRPHLHFNCLFCSPSSCPFPSICIIVMSVNALRRWKECVGGRPGVKWLFYSRCPILILRGNINMCLRLDSRFCEMHLEFIIVATTVSCHCKEIFAQQFRRAASQIDLSITWFISEMFLSVRILTAVTLSKNQVSAKMLNYTAF